jgi:hypothetical protein
MVKPRKSDAPKPRRPGRPATGKERLQLKISPALSAQLRRRAATTKCSMSEITEAALQEYLEER